VSFESTCIGIDFGTSYSSVAWFNPETKRAEILKNAEGEDKTPSVVYYGLSETIVGKAAEDMLEDEQERQRVIFSVKRELISAPTISLLGGGRIKPVEVAAEILRKLRADADTYHFHTPVAKAVITCPATFDVLERDKVAQAGKLAGFEEVVILEEPVAAALAYQRTAENANRGSLLVYDLGGGTFDLAVLTQDTEQGGYRLAMEPKGILRCGGDDFDRALYDYCDGIAQEKLRRPISLTERLDLRFLRDCRRRKENLSIQQRGAFSSYLASDDGAVLFRHDIERTQLEGLIRDYVDATVRLTQALLNDAKARGINIETVVLVGGSSRVPLVQKMLTETLFPLEPRKWGQQDVAVALGAAYHAESLWGEPKPTPAVSPDGPTEEPARIADANMPKQLENDLKRLLKLKKNDGLPSKG
jgi:molecular chaperone DnaK (HSP70)